MRPSRPSQEMLWIWLGATCCGVQVFTATPSVALTSSTLSAAADAPDSRNEKVTAGRAPTNAFVRLVPVSSRGAPVTPGPGTGDSSGFGSGGSGGGGGGRVGGGGGGPVLAGDPAGRP